MTQPSLFDPETIIAAQVPDQDICFNRHGGADTSVMADKRVRKTQDRAWILGAIKAAGAYGLTLDEASILLDRPCNCISGRFSELCHKTKEIIKTERTRLTRMGSHAHVYIAA
jgi:hypothetical protein